jgi:hypothetical protein
LCLRRLCLSTSTRGSARAVAAPMARRIPAGV